VDRERADAIGDLDCQHRRPPVRIGGATRRKSARSSLAAPAVAMPGPLAVVRQAPTRRPRVSMFRPVRSLQAALDALRIDAVDAVLADRLTCPARAAQLAPRRSRFRNRESVAYLIVAPRSDWWTVGAPCARPETARLRRRGPSSSGFWGKQCVRSGRSGSSIGLFCITEKGISDHGF